MRLAKQSCPCPLNLEKLFYLERGPCKGRPYQSSESHLGLVHRGILSLPFCGSQALGLWVAGD